MIFYGVRTPSYMLSDVQIATKNKYTTASPQVVVFIWCAHKVHKGFDAMHCIYFTRRTFMGRNFRFFALFGHFHETKSPRKGMTCIYIFLPVKYKVQ